MEQTAQKITTEKTEAKYFNRAGVPEEYQTESMYDYIGLQLAPLRSLLYNVADREPEGVGYLLDVAMPVLKDAETRIYKALDVIEDKLGSIELDVNERTFFDKDILGITFTPANEYKYECNLDGAKNSIEMVKQGAFTTIESYKGCLRSGIKDAEAVIAHAEDMKQKAEALKAEAQEFLHKFETGVLTLRRQK